MADIHCPDCGSSSWYRTLEREATYRQTLNFEGSELDAWGTEKLLGEDTIDTSNWTCENQHIALDATQDDLEEIAMDVDFVP